MGNGRRRNGRPHHFETWNRAAEGRLFAPDSQRRDEFALGYTEPEAGSDLASLDIRAEDRGDHYQINGQKMFNTRAHYAQYHWLGARTE